MAAISSRMRISIAPEIFERYPEAKSCFLLAKVPVLKKSKGEQKRFLSDFKQRLIEVVRSKGVNSDNFMNLRVCRSWEEVFKSFDVGEEKHSTIVNLLARVCAEERRVQEAADEGRSVKANLGNISNFVDLYNCVSIEQLTPMGALDLSKIQGDIRLREGREGEVFVPLGKDAEPQSVESKHIVYADTKNVLTWLWNYRDAAHACVPNESPMVDGVRKHSYILLFADQAHSDDAEKTAPVEELPGDAERAILRVAELLPHIGGSWLVYDCLHSRRPSVELDLDRLGEDEVSVEPAVEGTSQETAATGGAADAGE